MSLYQSARIFTEPLIEVTLDSQEVVVNIDDGSNPVEITLDGQTVVWGDIEGSINNQADLQSALDLKVPYTGATGNVTLGEYGLTTGYVQFDITPTTYTPAIGNLGWNDTVGTLETTLKGGNVSLKIGRDMFERVVNKTGVQLTKAAYQVVRVSTAQGQRLGVALAQANNDNNSADTLGLAVETIDVNQEGYIYTVGEVSNINTTGTLQGETWTDGDVLYLSPTTAGRITNVKPQAPQHIVIIGYVVYAHQNNGKIYVKIMNGWEISELHDVRITNPTNGQILKYNSTLSVWENGTDAGGITSIATSSPITGGTITTSGTIGITQATTSTDGYLSSTDWNTFNGKQNALTNPVTGTGTTNELTYFTGSTTVSSLSTATYPSLTELSYVKGVTSSIQTQLNGKQATLTNPITGTGTSGQVAYFNGTTSLTSEANLFWDATNDRLGIGTSSPAYPLDIVGTTALTGSARLLSSSSNNRLEIWTTNANASSRNWAIAANTNAFGDFAIRQSDAKDGQPSSGTIRLYLSSGGNVLIGSLTDNNNRFQVTGLSSFTGTTASDGGQLGAELLSSSNWTSTGWTGDYTLGFTHTVGNTTALTNTLAAVNGTYYQIAYTVTGRTAGTFSIAFGGVTTSGLSATGAVGPRATSTGTLSITPTTDFDGTIVISIKVISESSASISLRNSAGTVTNEIRNATANTNTFIGLNAGSRVTTATENTFYGRLSGQNTTTGTTNTFIGMRAGLNNTTATSNTFIGGYSGQNNISGNNNTFVGAFSGNNNSTGGSNTFVGINAGQANTTGSSNSAFGDLSQFTGSSANNNTSVGSASLYATTGSTNSAVGAGCLFNITTGSGNSALGFGAGRYAGASTTANQTSSNSLYLGYQTRSSASGNTNEVVIGYNVVGLGSNTTILGNSSTVTTGIYGNLLLGSVVDGGHRLQVTGTSALFNVTNLYVGNSTTSARLVTTGTFNQALGVNVANNTEILKLTSGSIVNGITDNANLFEVNQSITSSTLTNIANTAITGSFSPSSGSVNYYANRILVTINQTGGANGITRGLYVNPTLTAAADWRSIEWSNTSGWGLYGAGTANNYLAGSLGIGTTSLGASNLVIRKAITGATALTSVYANSVVQSDVTNIAVYYGTDVSTQNTTFTLNNLVHYRAAVTSIGASSTVTAQYGYFATSSLIGATNNYGFYGDIPSAANRWNLYMNGTASNYLNGNLLIGSTTERLKLTVSGSDSNAPSLGTASGSVLISNSNVNYGTMFGVSAGGWGWIQQQRVDGTATSYFLALQPSGGNVLIGTATDSGQKFQVNGSSLITGTASFSGSVVFSDINLVLGTTTGTKIGTATTQKISFWNATPIVQPTTAVASATRVGGGGTALTDTDTFDGYTLSQIVKALRNTGLLA